MKTHTSLVIIAYLFVFSISDAQIVLNSDEMMGVGSSYIMKTVTDFDDIDTTIQGANVTWNFAGLQENTSVTEYSVLMVDPASTPYGFGVPSSNYAYQEGPTLAYRYFTKTADKLERVGSWYNNVFKTYNDPQIEYTFPMQLGASNTDTWDNDISSTGGTYSFECIGTGTLLLPGGGSHSALMIRAHAIEGSLIDFYAYYWYGADNGAILTSRIVGDGFFIADDGRYTTDLNAVNTSTEEKKPLSGLSFNNPVTDYLYMSFNSRETGMLNYTVFNSTGQTIASAKEAVSAGQRNNLSFDLSYLSTGIYFIKMEDVHGLNAQTIKFIKK